MKRILTTALLAVVFSAFNFACKKGDEPNSNRKTDESNSNRKADESNSNTSPANAGPAQAAQDDGGQLLNDLKDTVHQYSLATIRGDKVTLQRLVAEDFSQQYGGKTYNKADWIGEAPGIAGITSHDVENAEVLNHTQFTATLGFDDRTTFNDGRPTATFRTKTNLVKRDGRWQILSFEK